MKVHPIVFAIPVFLLMIVVEVTLARRRGLHAYRLFDAITDLGCGIGNQVTSIGFQAVLLGLYALVHDRWTLVRFDAGSPWPWVIAIVGADFLYYWWHRASHEVAALWAAHVVHHQSEDYNLAVALRQALFTTLTSIPFYVPLALFGVPAPVFAASIAINLAYQFWIHTELVRKLPAPFEFIFNTPSQHRVHHATNPEYLDRNYAGIFSIWDRMFGTFEPERAPCVYGVTVPFVSCNPVWANFVYWAELFRVASRTTGLRRLLVFAKPPGWNPATGIVEHPPFVPREQFVKWSFPEPSKAVALWIQGNFAVIGGLLITVLVLQARLPVWVVGACGATIFLATIAWAGLLEGRRWARPVEAVRVVATVAAAALLLTNA